MNKETGFAVLLIVALVLLIVLKKLDTKKAEPKAAQAGSGPYDDIIRKYSELNSIPFYILKGVVWRESAFNPNARNDERLKGDPSDDAHGLMQIRQGALTDYNRANLSTVTTKDLYNPEINIKVGAWYLGGLIARNGIEAGVEMYNVGEAGYKQGRRNTKYLAAVVNKYEGTA